MNGGISSATVSGKEGTVYRPRMPGLSQREYRLSEFIEEQLPPALDLRSSVLRRQLTVGLRGLSAGDRTHDPTHPGATSRRS